MTQTKCCICGLPCPGTDADDEACCLACFTANLAGAELRPPASVTRRWLGLLGEGAREVVAEGNGRTGDDDPTIILRPLRPR